MQIANKFILEQDNGTKQIGTNLLLSYNKGIYNIVSYETTREKHTDWKGRAYWSEITNIFDCNYKTHFSMAKRKSEKQTKIAMTYFEELYRKLKGDK